MDICPQNLITDNILVWFKIHHVINSLVSRKTDYMILKLSATKAYNRAKWIFLKKILLHLGTKSRFVDDTMVFGRATIEDAWALKGVLKAYACRGLMPCYQFWKIFHDVQ